MMHIENSMKYLLFAAALVVVLLQGCTSGPPHKLELMPAPAVYEQSGAPYGNAADIPVDTDRLEMLYATNRAPSSDGDEGDEPWYSGERGYLVRLGSAEIDFGDSDLSWDEARRISMLKERPRKFPLRISSVKEAGILASSISVFTPAEFAARVDDTPSREFARVINERLSRAELKDVFIYVHGYKVNFENPLLVASELWHFLGYEDAAIAFSWPSMPARLAHMKDIETARVSAWRLRKFLDFLATETNAQRIHIVGYSAGTRVVLTTLYELALLHQHDRNADISDRTRLGNVILVGSDVDTGTFASYIIDGLLRVQDRLTLYISPGDQALHLSQKLFAQRRLGQILPGTLDERMRQFADASYRFALIDVEEADHFDDGNGHAYFRTSPWVSSDILITLRHGLGPAQRGLEQRDNSPVWRSPRDYPVHSGKALVQTVDVIR